MPLWIRYDGLEAGGQHGDVFINDSAPLSTDLRFDRTDRLGRDGQMAGIDLISKRVWDFTLYTNKRSEDDAVALAQAWERAWHDAEVRSGVKKVPLEYSRDRATWYRVYGRPTLFTGPKLDVLTRQGRGQIDVQFEQLDPWHYSDRESHTELGLGSSAVGGLHFPLSFPLHFGGGGESNQRYAINSGDKPAPVRLEIHGPLRDPVVSVVGGWRFALSGRLNWDETLVVDGRAHTVEIVSSTGGEPRAAFTWIRAGSRLTDLVFQPGHNTLEFRAIDSTGTASVDVYWPHTYQAMQ